MRIKRNFIIEKRNILNEIRSTSMTIQELRFFSIYLAKINPRNPSTRLVRFNLPDFQKIMELGKLNLQQLRETVDGLLCKVVGVPLDTGGYTRFQLFKKCSFTKNEHGEWYIEIDAHDEALPYMFEFKDRYFTYHLWNALRLKSSNQLRMYEILKQYEKYGERIISVSELRALLGINPKEYGLFNNFRVHVLDVCQKSLAENTDIKFSYEAAGKRGKGGKILELKFIIQKNVEHRDKLTLDEFMKQQELAGDDGDELLDGYTPAEDTDSEITILSFIAEACNKEFSLKEIQVLYNLIIQIVPYRTGRNTELEFYNYLKQKYDELNWRASQRPIKNRFGYIKKLIQTNLSAE